MNKQQEAQKPVEETSGTPPQLSAMEELWDEYFDEERQAMAALREARS